MVTATQLRGATRIQVRQLAQKEASLQQQEAEINKQIAEEQKKQIEEQQRQQSEYTTQQTEYLQQQELQRQAQIQLNEFVERQKTTGVIKGSQIKILEEAYQRAGYPKGYGEYKYITELRKTPEFGKIQALAIRSSELGRPTSVESSEYYARLEAQQVPPITEPSKVFDFETFTQSRMTPAQKELYDIAKSYKQIPTPPPKPSFSFGVQNVIPNIVSAYKTVSNIPAPIPTRNVEGFTGFRKGTVGEAVSGGSKVVQEELVMTSRGIGNVYNYLFPKETQVTKTTEAITTPLYKKETMVGEPGKQTTPSNVFIPAGTEKRTIFGELKPLVTAAPYIAAYATPVVGGSLLFGQVVTGAETLKDYKEIAKKEAEKQYMEMIKQPLEPGYEYPTISEFKKQYLKDYESQVKTSAYWNIGIPLAIGGAIGAYKGIKLARTPIIEFEPIIVKAKIPQPTIFGELIGRDVLETTSGKSIIKEYYNLEGAVTTAKEGSITKVTTKGREFFGMKPIEDRAKQLKLLEKQGYTLQESKQILRKINPQERLQTLQGFKTPVKKGQRFIAEVIYGDVDKAQINLLGSIKEVPLKSIGTGVLTGRKFGTLLKRGKQEFVSAYGIDIGEDVSKYSSQIKKSLLTKEGKPFSKLSMAGKTTTTEESVVTADYLGDINNYQVYETSQAAKQINPLKRKLIESNAYVLLKTGKEVPTVYIKQPEQIFDIVKATPQEQVLYHGTTTKLSKNILLEGLKPSAKTGVYQGIAKPLNFVSTGASKEQALGYATRAALKKGSKPLILKVNIPKDKLSKYAVSSKKLTGVSEIRFKNVPSNYLSIESPPLVQSGVNKEVAKAVSSIIKKPTFKTTSIPELKPNEQLPSMVGGKGLITIPYAGTMTYEQTQTNAFQVPLISQKVMIEPKIIEKPKVNVAVVPSIKVSETTKVWEGLKQPTAIKQEVKVQEKVVQQERIIEKLAEAQKQLQQQKQVQKNIFKNVQRQVQKLKTPTPRGTRVIIPKTSFGDFLKKSAKKIVGIQAYKVEVRKAGKFMEIGKPLPLGKALQLGTRETISTLRQTFRLKPAGTTLEPDITFNVPGKIFTKLKQPTTNLEWVERRGMTLKRGTGEIPEIQRARKSSQSFFKKTKKRRFLF